MDSIEANKGYTFEEQFKQLYDLSNDPKRKEFLDDLFQFMADRNQPVNRIPIMAKQVLDLYELYNLVVARGGLVEVINKKIWREITKGLNLPSSITSAAFTLRTQYMKYLYPYECAKNNFSHQDELQQAIDGNRREGRRAGYGPYMANGEPPNHHLGVTYSASPSPNHLFAGHNLLAAAAAQAQAHQQQHQHQQNQHQHHHHQQQQQQQQQLQQQLQQHQLQQQQPLRLHRDPESGSSRPSASPSFTRQRFYQDSIESDDHEDEGSIDLGHSPKRSSSPVGPHENQHLDSHNHISPQQAAEQHQQQLAAAAAAALRQQLGAAINFAGGQNFLGQLSAAQTGNPTPNPTPNQGVTSTNGSANSADLLKQQQEQFLAALMAATNQQQPPLPPPPPTSQQAQQQAQAQPAGNGNSGAATAAAIAAAAAQASGTDQQAARAALSMMASNAMLIAASNAPDAMAVATAAQAIGVKGAFIILLL